MKQSSRLLACAVPLVALAGCNAPGGSPSSNDQPSLAQQACERKDVQDVVSNEVKSVFQKGYYENAGTAILLIDPRQIAAEFEQARASFHDVTSTGPDADKLPTERVVCTGTLQIDESNASQGQQILQVPKLRWSIEFAQAVNDPQSSAFSISLDRGSLADDLRFNGEPIQSTRNQQRAAAPAAHNDGRDTREVTDQVAEAQKAGERAANAAGDAAAAASAAAADAERELKTELGK